MNKVPQETSDQERVEVTAPSRLHFGLMSFGHPNQRQFGGVGLMIDQPSVRLEVTACPAFRASGPHSERVESLARSWADFHALEEIPACHLRVDGIPPLHTGLGVGTQLGLSVAAGLTAFHKFTMPSPSELAISVGRGARSAVGTHGFGQGGLIAEGGKLAGERISPLDCRLAVPEAWRFVMICPRTFVGLSGDSERQAFSALPSIPAERTLLLQAEARDHLLPAAVRHDFRQFSESLYRYGRGSGECFAEQQGGPYNGPLLTNIVETIRGLGVQGVGQSSWGPTIYCVLESEATARALGTRLESEYSKDEFRVWLSAPNNKGVHIQVTNPSTNVDSSRTHSLC